MKDIIKLELNPCENELIASLLLKASIESRIAGNKDMEKEIEAIMEKFYSNVKEAMEEIK